MGLFRSAEWAALARRANAYAVLKKSIRRRYPALTDDELLEEAIADMLVGWVRDRKAKGPNAHAFERILAFVGSVSEWMKG